VTRATSDARSRDGRGAHLRALVQVSDAHAAAQVRAALLRRGALLIEPTSVPRPHAFASAFSPQLLIADLTRDGLELAATLKGQCGTSALFVTRHVDPRLIRECVEIDAVGILSLPLDERQLAATLQFAAARHRHSTQEVRMGATLAAALEDAAAAAIPAATIELLRPRERDVVAPLLQYKRVPAIAEALGISPETVRNHLKHIFKRTGTSSQQHLLDWLRSGASGPDTHLRVVPFRLSPRSTPRRLQTGAAPGADAGGSGHAADKS
jgi:DNA-binding NarL/FixJ family response regulator